MTVGTTGKEKSTLQLKLTLPFALLNRVHTLPIQTI